MVVDIVVNIEEFEKNLELYIDPFEIPGAMQALYDSARQSRQKERASDERV